MSGHAQMLSDRQRANAFQKQGSLIQGHWSWPCQRGDRERPPCGFITGRQKNITLDGGLAAGEGQMDVG